MTLAEMLDGDAGPAFGAEFEDAVGRLAKEVGNGNLKCRWHNHHKPNYTITTDPTTGRTHWHKHEP